MSKWGDITQTVLQDIVSNNGEPGSMAKIAERTGLTVGAVGIAIRNLKNKNQVAIAEQGNWKRPNTYSIIEQADPHEDEETEINRLTLEGEL